MTPDMKSIKNILITTFLILSAILLLFPRPTQAVAPDENLGDILNSGDISQEKYFIGNTQETGLGDTFLNYFSVSLTGLEDSEGKLAKGGMIPAIGSTIAYLYQNQPVSSGEYFADVMDSIGLPSPQSAQAQGAGYKLLSSMLPIWKVFRNLAYSLYIIIFAVIGLMIMFRTKINAQTVIAVQNALPNLIITLILITFSYAIAGLLVDLMYFLIYFIVYLAYAGGLLNNPAPALSRLLSQNAWSVIFEGKNAIVEGAAGAIGAIFTDLTFGNTLSSLWENISSGAVSGLAYLIIAAAFAIQMLKLIVELMKAYIMILVQTFTAPIQILFNALPESQAFMKWLKKTVAYLAPFPVVAAMFLFGAILIGPSNNKWIAGNTNPFDVNENTINVDVDSSFLPPFIQFTAHATPPDAGSTLGLLGFFVILMTPAAAKMARETLQVEESPYTAEIGAAIGTGGALTGRAWGIRRGIREKQEAREIMRQQASLTGEAVATKLKSKKS